MLIYNGCGKWYRGNKNKLSIPSTTERKIIIDNIESFKKTWNVSIILNYRELERYTEEHHFYMIDDSKLQAYCNWKYIETQNIFSIKELAIDLAEQHNRQFILSNINFILNNTKHKDPKLLILINSDLVHRDTTYKLIKLFQNSYMKIVENENDKEKNILLKYKPNNVTLQGPVSLRQVTSDKYDKNIYIFGDVHIKEATCFRYMGDNVISLIKFIDQEIRINNKTIDLYIESDYLPKNYDRISGKESYIKDFVKNYSKCLSLDKTGCGYGDYFRAHYVDIRQNVPVLGTSFFIAITSTLHNIERAIFTDDYTKLIRSWNNLVLYNAKLWKNITENLKKLPTNAPIREPIRDTLDRYIKSLPEPIDLKKVYDKLSVLNEISTDNDLYDRGEKVRHMEWPAPLSTKIILENYMPIMKELGRYTSIEDTEIAYTIYKRYNDDLESSLDNFLNVLEKIFPIFESILSRLASEKHINTQDDISNFIEIKKIFKNFRKKYYNLLIEAYTIARIFKPITMPDKSVTYAKNIIIYVGDAHAINIFSFLLNTFEFTVHNDIVSMDRQSDFQCLNITDLQRPLF